MKASLLFISVCWFAMCSISATDLTGHIAEQVTGQPLEFVDVALYRTTDSVFVSGSITDDKGKFALISIETGTYYVEYSFIGYETQCSSDFKVEKQRTLDVGTFYMRPSFGQLGEVVVQGRRSTYVQHIDRRVFNVGNDLMNTSGSVSDLMRNIPSVQVDVEGRVSLCGSENVNILIDGKPSTLMNIRTRADALRQMPANEIERIEVSLIPQQPISPME